MKSRIQARENFRKLTSSVDSSKVLIVSFIFFATYLLLWGLAKGGRWDLYQQLAMADRISTGDLYSSGQTDNYKVSTFYLPAGSFLIIPLKLIGIDIEEILLLIGVVLIVLLFREMFKIYEVFSKKSNQWQFYSISSLLSFTFLRDWLAYAIELKPDTLALLCFLRAVRGFSLKRKLLSHTASTALLSLSLLAKQQIFLPVCLYLLSNFLLHRKLGSPATNQLSNSGLIAVIISFTVMVCSPNLIEFAITSHIGKGLVSKEFFIEILRASLPALILILLCTFLSIRGGMWSRDFLLSKFPYLLFSASFFLICCLSAISQGGNVGNISVGIVPVIPLLILSLEPLFKRKLRIASQYIALLLFAYLTLNGNLYEEYTNRRIFQSEILMTLSSISDLDQKKVLITDNSYLVIRDLEFQDIISYDAWAHLNKNSSLDLSAKNDLLLRVKPEVVVCVYTCKLEIPLIAKEFKTLGYHSVDVGQKTDYVYVFRNTSPKVN